MNPKKVTSNYLLLLILFVSCSNLKTRIKNISPDKAIDQLEELGLYGIWKSEEGAIFFNCSGRFLLKYNYQNVRYKDNGGHVSKIDTKNKIIHIKETLFESAYSYKYINDQLKIKKLKNSQENLVSGHISFTLTKIKKYDCKKLREMGPIDLSNYYLNQ